MSRKTNTFWNINTICYLCNDFCFPSLSLSTASLTNQSLKIVNALAICSWMKEALHLAKYLKIVWQAYLTRVFLGYDDKQTNLKTLILLPLPAITTVLKENPSQGVTVSLYCSLLRGTEMSPFALVNLWQIIWKIISVSREVSTLWKNNHLFFCLCNDMICQPFFNLVLLKQQATYD